MSDIPANLQHIFKNGSTTYYYTSLFYPSHVKKDVFVLYSFVRTVDNFVDSIPQQKKEFLHFRKSYEHAIKGKKAENPIISEFIALMKKRQIKKEWVDAFLDAMESDLNNHSFQSIEELEKYMYGSAEVIGLMMAKILELPEESYTGAQLLGKSMQYANFIRDVQEDLDLGRQYLPTKQAKKWDISSLSHGEVITKKDKYIEFMQEQVLLYRQWKKEAEESFKYLPYRYRIPIQTASEMYDWTMNQIFIDPFIVYEKKLKPTVPQIIQAIMKNMVLLLFLR